MIKTFHVIVIVTSKNNLLSFKTNCEIFLQKATIRINVIENLDIWHCGLDIMIIPKIN